MMSSRIWPRSPQISEYCARPCAEPPGVVRGEPLDELEGVRAAHVEAAHVREVEDADASPHGQVLGPDAGLVLDRHVPAAEVDHAGSGGEMPVVEGGPEERSSCRGVTCHTAAS